MRWARHGGTVVTAAVLLFVAITVLRWYATDPLDGVTVMYTLPVALLASRFGFRTGVAAGLVAFALMLVWIVAKQVDFGPLAFGSRLVSFLAVGAAVGAIADQRERAAAQSRRLELAEQVQARRSRQAEQLQALVSRLSRAATLEQVAEAYTSQGVPLLGASQGGVFVDTGTVRRSTDHVPHAAAGPATLSLVAVHRKLQGSREWQVVRLEDRTPPTDAARTSTFNYQRDVPEMLVAYPALTAVREQSGDQAWAAGPLLTATGVIGALAAGFDRPQPFDDEQRELFATVASRVAEALDRASLLEVAGQERARAEASEQRASLLADVGAVLTGSSGSAERMQQLLDLLVPAFADMGTVELAHPDRLEVLAAQHADPAHREALERLRRLHAADPPSVPNLNHVVTSGRAELGVTIPEPVRRRATDAGPESAELIAELEPASFVAVPLRARGTVLAGLLLMQSAASGRQFDEADLALAELVAGRAALALDNAILYEQQQDVVTTLQHALLPGRLPRIDGVTATARYRPGMAALDVGGDWYDLLALPGGRVAIVLGDVVGRGVDAATTMGQLRSAVAALAPYCTGPAEVLRRLDRFAAGVPGGELATVAYVEFDPGTGVLRYSCAGHPPPLLVGPDGVRLLDGGRGVPLATSVPVPREEASLTLEAAATLICYSDGLVERRGTDIDTRLEQLQEAVGALAGGPLTSLCDGVLDRMVGDTPLNDDVALLCADLQRPPTARFHRVAPAEPGILVQLRRELRAWSARAGLDPTTTGDLLLATGEACANAIEHAYLGDRPAELELDVALDNGSGLVARVTDTGRWRDRAHDFPYRGRGLTLIRATMPEVSIEQLPTGGTTVTMRRPGALRTG
jgi:serine phosphatase RsbU (regulator of sigma subunit)/anti-sigma regulatory factor (Ser/Thr protein kinase)